MQILSQLPPFLFEFWYLPATLASKVTPVAFTEVAGRITVLLPNRALGYSDTLVFGHIITSFLGIVISRNSPSGLLLKPYATALAVLLMLVQHSCEFLPSHIRLLHEGYADLSAGADG